MGQKNEIKQKEENALTIFYLQLNVYLKNFVLIFSPILVSRTAEVKQSASYRRMMAPAIEAHLNRILQVYLR
jgi:hypothetical protein